MDMHSNSNMDTGAGLEANSGVKHHTTIKHTYHVECFRDGNLLWEDTFDNLVTTEGLNTYLDFTLKTGAASPSWYVGLVDNSGYTAYSADDLGSELTLTANPPTTTSWQEADDYTEGTREAYTPGTISGGSVDNSASKASFSINGTVTIRGAFLVYNDSTKGGATGKLLGVGDFTGGSRSVISGDTLNVTVTCSIS